MFSKELRELDQNTVQYMIDQMQEEIDRQKDLLGEKQDTITQQQYLMEGSFDAAAFASGDYILAVGPSVEPGESYPVLPTSPVGSVVELNGRSYTVMAIVYPLNPVTQLAPQLHWRLLPYRAVGVKGVLLAFQAKQVTLAGRVIPRMTVALAPTPVSDGGGYSGLLGGVV